MGIADWFGLGKKEPPRTEPIIEVPPVPTSESLLAALDEVERMAADGKVPGMVMARLKRVTKVVRQTVPRLDAIGGDGSSSAYNVMATATDYLPGAIGGYLRLPRDWADSRPVDRGKTSLLILIDQLDLLGATMDKIFDAVCRADAEALVVHGRFLQEKFGQPGGGQMALGEGAILPPMPGMPPPSPPAASSPSASGPLARDDDTGDVPLVHPRAQSASSGNPLDLPRTYPTEASGPPEPGRLTPPIGREGR